jgi:transmembrane 9 superfamily protein 3
MHPLVNIILGGILPFGSIFIEMYFIFTSFWHYKYYYVYGFMLLVYIILVVVTVCVTIVSTYFLLNSEDYRWQWVSYFSASSTAFYVFLYAVYYFFAKTHMSGFFQTCFYFGYMGMFCIGLGITTGERKFFVYFPFLKFFFLMTSSCSLAHIRRHWLLWNERLRQENLSECESRLIGQF